MPEQTKSAVVIVEFTTGEEEVLRLPILARTDHGEDHGLGGGRKTAFLNEADGIRTRNHFKRRSRSIVRLECG